MIVTPCGYVLYPLHLQMVAILQIASRRPFSVLPVTIFTVMMNNCQPDAKSSYFLPFAFLALLWNLSMAIRWGEGGGKDKKNSSNTITKSSLLVPSLYIKAQLGKQTEF